jgi:hypothetical protein
VPAATEPPKLPAEEPPFEDRTGPTSLLASYYNAISRREFARAWAYWESPPSPSYEALVRGLFDAASVRLAVCPPIWFEGTAGSTYSEVSALVTSIGADGRRDHFVGCYVARRSSVEGPDATPVWSLHDASVRPTPGNSSDALQLASVCDTTPAVSYDDRSGPVRLLASYYNALDQREYARAWAYWDTEPAPTFEAFVQGFAETASLMLVVQPPTRLEGAAGSVYAAVPALVIATHRDASRHNFVGCFVARRSNVGPPDAEQDWSLFDAALQPAPSNTTDVMMLYQVCVEP